MGRAAAGVALGLGLAGFWLDPALYEQRWVEIARAIGPLMRVEDSFLFGYAQLAGVSADERFDVIYHNQVLRTVSWIVVGADGRCGGRGVACAEKAQTRSGCRWS